MGVYVCNVKINEDVCQLEVRWAASGPNVVVCHHPKLSSIDWAEIAHMLTRQQGARMRAGRVNCMVVGHYTLSFFLLEFDQRFNRVCRSR